MSLYRRGGIWHYDFTVNRERFRGSTQQRSKTAALKVESRERERAKLGEASAPVPTLRQVADRWFAARIDGKPSAKTTAIRIEIMLRHLGDPLVTEIDTPDIEAAMQARRVEKTRQGKAPANATVNRDLIDSTTRPILRYAKRILKLPVQEIDWAELMLSEPKERSRSFTAEELAAWRAKLPPWHRDLFDFFKRYGLRLAEAFFPLNGVEPEAGRVTVRLRKNGLPHSLRLIGDDARDMAARYGRAREADLKTVWFKETKRGIRAITWRGFQSASRRALEAAGIVDARPVHDLRHHAATAFLRLPGANLKQAQRLLGHESIASTARYAHVDEADVFNTMRHAIVTEPENEPNSTTNTKVVRGT